MHKNICDRCGRENVEHIAKLGKIERTDFFGNQKYSLGEHFDLCEQCYKEAVIFFRKKGSDNSG